MAEAAGLNPRTVQRAETDGSGSLKTRLQLAEALRVRPDGIDLVEQSGTEGQPLPQFVQPDSHSRADVLTALTAISGTALLASLYLPRLSTAMMRHGDGANPGLIAARNRVGKDKSPAPNVAATLKTGTFSAASM